MAVNRGKILIVGCGPGSPEYLTGAARQAVARADVLVGSQRLLEMFPEAVEQPRTDAPMRSTEYSVLSTQYSDASPTRRHVTIGADVVPAIATIADLHASGLTVAVLVSGDPGLYSLGAQIVRRFGRDCCEVIPGVSSVQVAFARLGLDWADARIVSAHGRTPSLPPQQMRALTKVAILAGTRDALEWSAEAARALCDSHDIYLCENLTLESERVARLTPEELESVGAASLSIILLIRRSLLP